MDCDCADWACRVHVAKWRCTPSNCHLHILSHLKSAENPQNMTLMIARSAGAVPIKCAEHLDRHHTSRRSSPGHALPSALGNVLSRCS